MTNLRLRHQVEIKHLFDEFTNNITKELAGILDIRPGDFKLARKDSDPSKTFAPESIENSYMYNFSIDYTGSPLNITIFFSGSLLFALSDILTGGRGDAKYTGKLSEVQLNASFELITKTLNTVKSLLEIRYQKIVDIRPSELIKFQDKSVPDQNDFFVGYEISLYNQTNFDVHICTNETNLRDILSSLQLLSFEESKGENADILKNLEYIKDIKINLTAELGKTKLPVKTALELSRGSIVELDSEPDSEILIYADDVKIASAKIVAVDENYGIMITKIYNKEELKNLK